MRILIPTVLSVFFFASIGGAKSGPVYLDSLPTSKKIRLFFTRDTLLNCDPDSRVRRIIQDTLSAKQGGDDMFFPSLKADSLPVQKITYLNRSGDSLFFMATVTQDSVNHFYTSVCVDRKSIIRFSVDDSGSQDGDGEKKPAEHRGMGSRHAGGMGGGMGGMR